jgi:uncharacterized repeat protein (TIGR03803 family)
MVHLRLCFLLKALLLFVFVNTVFPLSPSKAQGGLVVTDLTNRTPTQLVQQILGPGVTVSNVQFKGVNKSAGTFTGGATIIGFPDGIILSSGDVRNVVGPNVSDFISTVINTSGDTNLNSLVPQSATQDATVLEFDFVPQNDTLSFQYVFASDEYYEYVSSQFNDVFGFFLNGQNVAVLPGTATAVSINTVNQISNTQFFRGNDLNQTPGGATINTEMDGLTTVLTVTVNVLKGQTNHIKLAVADVSDRIYDSNVFIRSASFASPDGARPYASLIKASDGNFYGTTDNGGSAGFGTVFQRTPSGLVTTIHSFLGPDGQSPRCTLVEGSDGQLYGTTLSGGAQGQGTVFKITKSGVLTTLHSFLGSDGSAPDSSLLLASDGKFYGTTVQGGSTDFGTIFRIDASGNFSTLYTFNGLEGCNPHSTLSEGPDGSLFGSAGGGGDANISLGHGTVFKISKSGSFVLLHVFSGTDGEYPGGRVVVDNSSNVYGTTQRGTTTNSGNGVVYKISASGSFSILHYFVTVDGQAPIGLILSGDGYLYGTTVQGGISSGNNTFGTVYRISTSGSFTNLYKFGGTDGYLPWGGLLEDNNVLYGTTSAGGSSNKGTLFSLTKTGNLSSLHSFNGIDSPVQ